MTEPEKSAREKGEGELMTEIPEHLLKRAQAARDKSRLQSRRPNRQPSPLPRPPVTHAFPKHC